MWGSLNHICYMSLFWANLKPGFVHRTNFLLRWDITPELRGFIGYEYETARGSRFFLQTPVKAVQGSFIFSTVANHADPFIFRWFIRNNCQCIGSSRTWKYATVCSGSKFTFGTNIKPEYRSADENMDCDTTWRQRSRHDFTLRTVSKTL